MTPDQIAALTAIATITSKVGTWPIGSIMFAIVIGPWGALFFISRDQEKRHSSMKKMYEDNVKLVESYKEIADGLQDIIVLSTQTMTRVDSKIDNNLFCPLMRKDRRVEKQP